MKINSNIIINSESRIRIKFDVKLNQNKNQRKLRDLRNCILLTHQIARLSSYSTVEIKNKKEKKKLKAKMAKEKREGRKIKNEKRYKFK